MENIFPGNAFRVGGDEFVIIETGIVKAQFFQKLDELRREMEKRKEKRELFYWCFMERE